MNNEKRIKELDGLRGVAIWMVLVWHYIGLQIRPALGPAALILQKSLILCRSGVDLFFVLSGYLITDILLRNRESSHYFQTFYGRRFARIFPPYFLVLGIFITAIYFHVRSPLFAHKIPIWSYIFFTQNYTMPNLGEDIWMAVTWSLAVEEQFYLILPMIIYFLKENWLTLFLIVGVFLSIVTKIILYFYHPSHYSAAYMWLPARLDSMFIGSIVAFILTRYGGQSQELFFRKYVYYFLLILAGIPILAYNVSKNIGLSMALWGHFYLAVFYGLTVLLVVMYRNKPAVSFFKNPFLTQMGKISYGVYLTHWIVLHAVFIYFGSWPGFRSYKDLIPIAISLFFTILSCSILYLSIERRFISLGHKLQY